MQVETLSRRGRAVRLAALAAGAAALLVGTFHGTDDAFPFGPFKMYAGAFPTTADVDSTGLRAVLADGRTVRVSDDAIGLRRAELEGRLPELVAHPGELVRIAEAHAARRPREPAYVQVLVVQQRIHVVHRHVRGSDEVVLARWSAP